MECCSQYLQFGDTPSARLDLDRQLLDVKLGQNPAILGVRIDHIIHGWIDFVRMAAVEVGSGGNNADAQALELLRDGRQRLDFVLVDVDHQTGQRRVQREEGLVGRKLSQDRMASALFHVDQDRETVQQVQGRCAFDVGVLPAVFHATHQYLLHHKNRHFKKNSSYQLNVLI